MFPDQARLLVLSKSGGKSVWIYAWNRCQKRVEAIVAGEDFEENGSSPSSTQGGDGAIDMVTNIIDIVAQLQNP